MAMVDKGYGSLSVGRAAPRACLLACLAPPPPIHTATQMLNKRPWQLAFTCHASRMQPGRRKGLCFGQFWHGGLFNPTLPPAPHAEALLAAGF